ncbi:MAG: NAD-dependent succinate-semialdehyde dehydrogenase, partial [Aeromicrobium sp.]|uniref:aldehyde dehydrogenase family protein n=1 Tax=Aeromicrobium sp. TaxID=1871063 RepID=UPI00260FA089
VLVDVPADAAIVHEEIFGPIAPIVTWTTDAEVIAMANDTEMGLAAYVFAGELQRAMRLGEAIEAGMVGINRGLVSDPAAPFGGMKQSGIGREGARIGMEELLETQYQSVDRPE